MLPTLHFLLFKTIFNFIIIFYFKNTLHFLPKVSLLGLSKLCL